MDGRFCGLAFAVATFAAFMLPASADDVAKTVRDWGLLGEWSADCSQPPTPGIRSRLIYEVRADGSVLHHRDFGSAGDDNAVTAARISSDGILHLEIDFPMLKQRRQFGLMKLPDGTLRSIYNRSNNGDYTIVDGKFTATGKPVPVQYRCK